jgi:hypothetical protein
MSACVMAVAVGVALGVARAVFRVVPCTRDEDRAVTRALRARIAATRAQRGPS